MQYIRHMTKFKQENLKELNDTMKVISYSYKNSIRYLRFIHKFLGCQGKAHTRANKIYLYGKDHDNKDGE